MVLGLLQSLDLLLLVLDSRGQALAAHSYDTALAFMDAQYKREMALEKELAAERAAGK